NINGRNIQVPCVSAFDCSAFTEGSIAQKSFTSSHAYYICSECFQQEGEHFYERLVTESSDLNLQEGLLALITPTLTILNKANQNSPKIETTNLPSKLIVRIVLKMGKDEAMKERTFVVTSEKASKMGEKLGREVLSSYSEIQKNISQLENPDSYENYFNALPNTICSFFQVLIIVLQQ
ncbi:4754_t:CDS:2, partial [Ambispora gerdemannii]